MANLCPKCGAANRPAAKFCKKCAHQMVQLFAETQQLDRHDWARGRRSSAGAPMHDSLGNRALLWGSLALCAAALLGGGALLLTRTPAQAPKPSAPTVAASTAPPVAPAASAEQADPSIAAVPPTPPVAAQEPASAPEPVAASPHAPTPVTSPATGAAPRTRVERDASRTPARHSAPATPAPVSAPVQAAAPAPAPAPPPAAPSGPASPNEACGNRGFLASASCMASECAKPAWRNHPQCVSLRERQQLLQRGSGEQ